MVDKPTKGRTDERANRAPTGIPAKMAQPWGEPVDCRRCELRPQTLFAVLRGSEFAALAPPIECAALPRGAVVYAEGAAADAVYTICGGLVQLTKASPSASPAAPARTVRVLGIGASVGLEALSYGLYWHTATTLQATRLCRLPLRVVEQLWTLNSHIGDRLMLEWSRQLAQADRWLVELCAGPVQSRVRSLVRLLMELSDGPKDEIELPSLKELSLLLGASDAAISRALAQMKRAGALRRVAPHRYACGPEALSC